MTQVKKLIEVAMGCESLFTSEKGTNRSYLFDMVTSIINLVGGILSVDNTVIEKLYSNPKHAELIGYFWSGKYHKTIKGLNLITLYYSDVNGNSVPLNYRIYDKKEGKTKNNYFQEMLIEVISWGLKPRLVRVEALVFRSRKLEIFNQPEIGFYIRC